MGRSKAFLINSATAAIYEIIIAISGFVISRIMLVYYGSEINGLVSSITQFINYFNLVEAGLSSAAIYALYKPLYMHDYKGINRIVSATQRLYIKSGAVFCILLIVLATVYPMYVECEGLTYVQIGLLVSVLGIKGVIDLFTLGKYRAILTADQKLYIISISSSIYQILYVVIIFSASRLGGDIVLVRVLALIPVIVRMAILVVFSRKKYPYLDYKEEPDYKAVDKRWDAFYLQILGSVQNGAPIVIATYFTDLISVSIYTVYNLVIAGVNSALSIFTTGLSSAFGEIIAKGEKDILKKTYSEFMTGYYMAITVIYGITHRLLIPFIQLYTENVNDAQYVNALIAVLFVLNGFFYNLKTPQGMLIISAGHYKQTRLQVTIQGSIVIILGCLLAPRFGLAGILVASVLSNIYRSIDLSYYVPMKITETKISGTVFRMIVSCILLGGIIFFDFCFPVTIFSWWEWIWNGVISGILFIIYVSVGMYMFFKKDCFLLLKRLYSLLKSKR